MLAHSCSIRCKTVGQQIYLALVYLDEEMMHSAVAGMKKDDRVAVVRTVWDFKDKPVTAAGRTVPTKAVKLYGTVVPPKK